LVLGEQGAAHLQDLAKDLDGLGVIPSLVVTHNFRVQLRRLLLQLLPTLRRQLLRRIGCGRADAGPQQQRHQHTDRTHVGSPHALFCLLNPTADVNEACGCTRCRSKPCSRNTGSSISSSTNCGLPAAPCFPTWPFSNPTAARGFGTGRCGGNPPNSPRISSSGTAHGVAPASSNIVPLPELSPLIL